MNKLQLKLVFFIFILNVKPILWFFFEPYCSYINFEVIIFAIGRVNWNEKGCESFSVLFNNLNNVSLEYTVSKQIKVIKFTIFVLEGECKIFIISFLKCEFLNVQIKTEKITKWFDYVIPCHKFQFFFSLVIHRPALKSILHILYNIISMYHIGDLQILIHIHFKINKVLIDIIIINL